MLRILFIVGILVPIFTIITLPLTLLGFLVGKWNKNAQYAIANLLTTWISNIYFLFNGAKITVKGIDNIPSNKDGALLFVGNHKGFSDIPLLIKYVPYTVIFIAKKSLQKVPWLSIYTNMLGCKYIDRDNVREAIKTIQEGIETLKNGHSMAIFPEGTRSKSEELLPFKQGSLKLAEKAGVLVVPFALKGTDDLFENNGYRLKRANVYITFGKPVDLTKLPKEERKKSASYIQNIVQEMYDDMR